MKLFILNYATQEDVDAVHDDPMEDIDLEVMASPQFHSICTEEHLAAAIAQAKQDVEDVMDELHEGAEELVEYTWAESEWADPIIGRRNRSLFLHEDGDEDPIARIVIQEYEAFTG